MGNPWEKYGEDSVLSKDFFGKEISEGRGKVEKKKFFGGQNFPLGKLSSKPAVETVWKILRRQRILQNGTFFRKRDEIFPQETKRKTTADEISPQQEIPHRVKGKSTFPKIQQGLLLRL